MNKDFAVFILTHGRANKVDTYNTLIKQGYTGTYVKSFYSVMYAPSCVKISTLGTSNKRIHY